MTLPRSDSLDTYGGIKQDFTPIVDATTDRSADEVNECFASVAGMTQTLTRAYFQFTGASSSSIVPNFHNAVWGSAIANIPVISRVSTGIFDVVYPTTIEDNLGNLQPVNFVMGSGSVEGDTLGFVTVTKSTPNTLRLHLFDETLAASDLVGVLINVLVI